MGGGGLSQKYSIDNENLENGVFGTKIPHLGQKLENGLCRSRIPH